MRNLIVQNMKQDIWMIFFSIYTESTISVVETVLTIIIRIGP